MHRTHFRSCHRRGFTLVELLVVIAIIGVLVGLLLPAIQAAHESARRSQCASQLKQMATAFATHYETRGHFPTGGWGWTWVGDADRGFGANQPGGWPYNLLPFIEEQNVHDLGKDDNPGQVTPGQKAGSLLATQSVIGVYICPSRRPAQLYPLNPSIVDGAGGTQAHNADGDASAYVNRIDYGANAGEVFLGWSSGPQTLDDTSALRDMTAATGIVYSRSMVRIPQISDGTSSTILLGEKYLNPNHYYTGIDPCDDHSALTGDDYDPHRWAARDGQNLPPRQDTAGFGTYLGYGSAHPGSFNAAFCDGSVQSIQYSVDMGVWRSICNRSDGMSVNVDSL